MRVADSRGNPIAATEQWRLLVGRDRWREGRSAHALADFIVNRNGTSHLESRISAVTSLQVNLEHGTPEYAARFDRYRGPARLDLGITGQTGQGESLFVGVEAKVDEPFGSSTVCQRYREAVRYREEVNPRSKAPARVRELLAGYFSDNAEPCASRFRDVGYQLLTAAAGTLASTGDVSVLYITVFRTNEFDEDRGRINRSNYDNFISLAGGKRLNPEAEEYMAHELILGGQRLFCIYEYL